MSGCDTLMGGYLDNVPEDAEFHQVDCQYLNAMKKLIAGADVVIHTACTAYEGLSVFSPHLVTQNTSQGEVRYASCSADKSRHIFGYKTMYTLRTTLADMARWIETRGPKRFRYHIDLEIMNERTPKAWSERLFT